MYVVYAVYNKKHDKIYIGQTQNLLERLTQHNEGVYRGSYTSRFDGEWVIIFTERHKTRKDALLREKQLKSYQGRKYVKACIPG